MIRENLGSGLDEDNRRYMDLVATSIDQQRIADLLRFAHLGRARGDPSGTHRYTGDGRGTQARSRLSPTASPPVRVGALPVIEGRPARCFARPCPTCCRMPTNYTRGTARLVIEVGTERDPDAKRFSSCATTAPASTGLRRPVFRPFAPALLTRIRRHRIGLATVRASSSDMAACVWAGAPIRAPSSRLAMPPGGIPEPLRGLRLAARRRRPGRAVRPWPSRSLPCRPPRHSGRRLTNRKPRVPRARAIIASASRIGRGATAVFARARCRSDVDG